MAKLLFLFIDSHVNKGWRMILLLFYIGCMIGREGQAIPLPILYGLIAELLFLFLLFLLFLLIRVSSQDSTLDSFTFFHRVKDKDIKTPYS